MHQHSRWTLRERNALDGTLQDHLSITRFARNRVFDVHLPPGNYELHVFVRRDEESSSNQGGGMTATSTTARTGTSSATSSTLGDDDDDDDHGDHDDDDDEVETSEMNAPNDNATRNNGNSNNTAQATTIGEFAALAGGGAAILKSRFQGIRHNIKSAARKTLETVTVGTVGKLSVECDISLLDNSTGHEIFSIQHVLGCAKNPAVEVPLSVENEDQSIRIKFHSTSTLHAIQVYAALYDAHHSHEGGESSGTLRRNASSSSSSTTSSGSSKQRQGLRRERGGDGNGMDHLITSASQASSPGGEGHVTAPFELLRRAVFGSTHPSRASFSRSLAMSCFMTLFGFVLGMRTAPGGTGESREVRQFVLGLAGFVAWFWVCRVALFALISVIPLTEGGRPREETRGDANDENDGGDDDGTQ